MPKQRVPSRFRGYHVSAVHWWELGQIARLEQTVFPEPMPFWGVVRKFLAPRTRYLVVRDGHRLIAYFGFEVVSPYAHVLANVTHPDYRRQGLAGFVLTAGQAWALNLGARAFLGEVRVSNLPQLAVLKGVGWSRLAIIPRGFKNGEDAYLVLKPFD